MQLQPMLIIWIQSKVNLNSTLYFKTYLRYPVLICFVTFNFKKLQISDVVLITPQNFSDSRGYFLESFKESEFNSFGISTQFVQDNQSASKKGVLRGLHYQINPKAQAKLVSVIKGKIFDVAVDIRQNSPTFGMWVGEILSGDNHKLLYVPKGFAHGFCVISDEANVIYKVNQEYSPQHDRGIIWNDPQLNISWPINNPNVSKKDDELPLLKNIKNNFLF